MSWQEVVKLLPAFLDGTWVAIKLFFITLIFSMPLGLLFAFGRMSKNKLLSGLIGIFQYIIRGTPLMLQLVFVMYFPSIQLGISGFSRFTAACVAFSINYAAYFSEIYRSGIESIPKGQVEAARVLGFSKSKTFLRIVWPQTFKRILPPLGNEFMTLVKDTALATAIGIIELLRVAQNHMNRSGSMVPIVVALVFYLIMNGIVNLFMNGLEKHYDYYKI
ncbi:MAG TPA: amino acid ABC transporter permease [Clostridiaceae bacterium]|nr:amino acid ABC transporter permease [Clostridiaceae bacterium]